jgi:hypothetical protein
MIVRVGKRIASGAFLMVEFGIIHLKPSGNYQGADKSLARPQLVNL